MTGHLPNAVRLTIRKSVLTVAGHYRRLFHKTRFVAITGSSGKTTAKLLTDAVLMKRGRGICNVGTYNAATRMVGVLLRLRRAHFYCLHELGASGPGGLEELVSTFQPDIGVITCVGLEHYASFRSLDNVATEKAEVIRRLPATGWAVLNRDDPYCTAMAKHTLARVLFFGHSPEADLRAEDVRASWPDRLAFTAVFQGQRVPVQTRLCGRVWITSVLAALGAGIAAGVPLTEAAAAVSTVNPFPHRMSPVDLGDGAVLLQDDWKNPAWSLPTLFEFLREARATRRILVLGKISDTPTKPSQLYPSIIKQAMTCAEIVLVAQPYTSRLPPEQHTQTSTALTLESVQKVNEYLHKHLRPGDLVVLRGGQNTDHLERLVLDRERPIQCWRRRCGLDIHCDQCKYLYRPFDPLQDPEHLKY